MRSPHRDSPPRLAEATRRLHRSLIDAVVATGSVPTLDELASRLGTSEEVVAAGLTALAAADYLARDASGQITCLYPFSTTATPHAVIINGQRRFAMCAIDALGMPRMLGQKLVVEACCAICVVPITLRVRPGEIVTALPPTAMVVARRDEDAPAFTACCPYTVFVCGQEHGAQFLDRVSSAHILPLSDALARAEEIFGGLLLDALPANRPRGRRWQAQATTEPILYTQAGCAESARVRAWLNERGIAFHERNASRDQDVARALAATGPFATPLLVVGEQKELGFRPGALAAALRTVGNEQ
jgi:glutaredoxin